MLCPSKIAIAFTLDFTLNHILKNMRKFTTTLLFMLAVLCAIPMLKAGISPIETAISEGPTYEVFDADTKKWSKVELDRNPEANGGDENFWNIVYSQMVYPDRAQRAKLEGDVVLTMTISEIGKLVALEVKQEVGGGCEEEAFNAIKLAATNRFIPAMLDGKPVKVRYDVSINFSMR